MPVSLYLLIPAVPLHWLYFARFSRLIGELDPDERARFIRAGTPLLNLLTIAPIALLLASAPWLRLAGALGVAVFLPIATARHDRRLGQAGFSADFRSKLLRVTLLSVPGLLLIILALGLR